MLKSRFKFNSIIKKQKGEVIKLKKEDFLKIGLTEEQAEQAAAASADELKGYVPKADYDTAASEIDTAQTSLTDLTGKLKAYDGVDVEKLKTDVKDWETKYNADIASVKKNAAVDMAILQAKGRNPKAIKALLDMEKIKLKDDGTLEGLDMEGLKESDGYLFDVEETKTVGTGAPKGGAGGMNENENFISAARSGAGLSSNK